MIAALLVLVLAYCVYWALHLKYKYWKKLGVPSPPASAIVGNLGPSLTLAKSVGQICTEIYNSYPDLLYVGFYKIRQPAILLRDPELIREILVKEFSSFHDNDLIVDEESDPVGGRNPFVLKGDRWKVVKGQISPCFTPKKLKGMYPLIEDSARKLIDYLEKESETAAEHGLEARELAAKYTTEVVASCVFGLEGKSFDEADPEFRRMGKKIFQPTTSTVIKLLLLTVVPSLAQFLKVQFFTDEVTEYFRNIIAAALKYREENNVVRNDFLDFMKELKNKPGEYEFTDTDVVAHCLAFFTDGLETSSSAIGFVLYELGANSDIQEKLYLEIQETLAQSDGKFDYETINDMQYLDAVVSESLRMHMPGMVLMRSCTKPFTLPPPRGAGTGPEVPLELDTPVLIPVHALHYDPKYFPDPERFNPDRFSEENRKSIVRGTYLPFGDGPRSCHGQRFGLLQTKLAVASVVARFEVKVNKKTVEPLEIDPAYLITHAKGGLWLNFIKRKS